MGSVPNDILAYWTRRSREALRMAKGATSSRSRLIHYELAGRCSVMAAGLEPFMMPRKKPATAVEGSLLRLQLPRPGPDPVPPRRVPPADRGPEARR